MLSVRRVAVLLLCCVASPAWARAQTEQLTIPVAVEYGELSELLCKKRVFVQADSLKARDKIVKELLKASRLRLEVVGRAEEADFFLVFGASLAETGQSAFGSILPGEGGDVAEVSGGLVALRLVGGEGSAGPRPRILWHTHKRQTFIRTDQFFRPHSSTSLRSNLIGSAIGGLLSTVPKLFMFPLGKSPEVKATSKFVKALKKVYGREAECARMATGFAAGERTRAASGALVGKSQGLQKPASAVRVPPDTVTLHPSRPLRAPATRARVVSARGRGRRSRVKARRGGRKVNGVSRRARTSAGRGARNF